MPNKDEHGGSQRDYEGPDRGSQNSRPGDDRDRYGKKRKDDGPFRDPEEEGEGEVDPHTEMNFGNESVITAEFDLLQNLIDTRRKDKGRNILLQGEEDPLAKLILLGGSA